MNTIPYMYSVEGYRDQLLQYGSESMAYDIMGNPTTYRGKSMVWEYGRRLSSYDGLQFGYGTDGIRKYKRQGDIKTEYSYLDGKVFREQRKNTVSGVSQDIYYHYGVEGICGFEYQGNTYTYRKNIQGDVTHILDINGEIVAKYEYDAWGAAR